MLKRQKLYWKILRPLVIVFLYFKFGYTFKTARNLPDNFILLSNHNTDFDPLLVGVSFKNSLRFVASEHISRWKHAFKFVNHVFSPIMRPKGTNAASTVKEMLRALRGGDNVCMFAEGARSWNGITNPILPSIGKLVKSSKCALVTYKITGGYFASPLWSEGGTRKGKLHGEIVNIYSAEDISKMSVDEINRIINTDLYEDAYDTQSKYRAKYKGKQLAVKMETMLFYCPFCGAMESLKSHKDTVTCFNCGKSFKYNVYGELEGTPLKNMKDAFCWLRDKVLEDAQNCVEYSTDSASITTVSNHIEKFLSNGKFTINKDILACGDVVINISDIDDLSYHGRYALVLSTKDGYFEISLNRDTSALKFYMLFQAYKYGDIIKFNF